MIPTAEQIQQSALEAGRAQMIDARTASARIRAARHAQQIAEYERDGWPLEVVQALALEPGLELGDALDWYSVPVQAVA